MNDINQVMTSIKEELQQQQPSASKILPILYDLKRKEEYQQLSDSEFYNIVGETFNLKPEFFMKTLYKPFRNVVTKLIGKDKLKEMEKHILEKYSLHEGEQIFFEFNGNLYQNAKMLKPLEMFPASFFLTNDRIIAQGKLKGPYHKYSSELGIYGYVIPIKNIYRLRRVRNNIRYRTKLGDRVTEINLKITLGGEGLEKREERIEKIFEHLNKEVIEELTA